jgi:dipeptidyl aminopeptidase/acylaminoacyl peptidase
MTHRCRPAITTATPTWSPDGLADLAWSPDSSTIAFTSYDTAAGTLVTTQSTIDHTPELYVGDDKRTSVGDALSAQLLGWEKFTTPTSDGSDEIDCWIMRRAPAGATSMAMTSCRFSTAHSTTTPSATALVSA